MKSKLVLALLLWLSSTLAYSRMANPYKDGVLTLNPKRTIEVIDVVDNSLFEDAGKLEEMSRKNSDPIFIIINSPGGSVVPGISFMGAMGVAQARGVHLICISGVYAASMAYYILSACDERYALKSTQLLFHPMRIGTDRGFTQEELAYLSEDLLRSETGMKETLRVGMKANSNWFEYHYRHETLWTAPNLNAALGWDWVTIVNDVQGTSKLYTTQKSMFRLLFGGYLESIPSVRERAVNWQFRTPKDY